jgi:hypothetical protein
MVDMVLGEDTPGYRARGGPLGVPVAWVSLLPRRGRMAEGHVARPLEKKKGDEPGARERKATTRARRRRRMLGRRGPISGQEAVGGDRSEERRHCD